MPKVTVIPANKVDSVSSPLFVKKKRVAGYARVSTEEEMQASSFKSQLEYYTNYIKSNPEWEFVDLYSDYGISGTGIKNRDGFNKMIKDAKDGKIDMIITKSVSRFARNTVDNLVTIRELKAIGVEVYFETENVHTLDATGELMLTILASMAQEESRHISENITWGKRKLMRDGVVTLAYSRFLGYDKDEKTGKLVINKEQAQIVKLIYHEFMKGKSIYQICELLNSMCIKTPSGKERWQKSTVKSILTNEKYKGDALLQKTYVKDYLTHQAVLNPNDGTVPQYYVEGHHEPIIEPDYWEKVQVEIARRDAIGYSFSSKSIFASKLICGDCGGFYGAKIWHSNDKYRKQVFRCNNMFDKNKDQCKTPILEESEIKSRFLIAYNEFIKDKTLVIEDAKVMLEVVDKQQELNEEIDNLNQELEIVIGLAKKLIDDNATKILDQNAVNKKLQNYDKKQKNIMENLKVAQAKLRDNRVKVKSIEYFIKDIQNQPSSLEKWSNDLWCYMIDKAIVEHTGKIRFIFRTGKEIIA